MLTIQLLMADIRKNFCRAFTLIELMIVLVILGLIAAFAIPNYNNAITASRMDDAEIQLRAIHAANRIYRLQSTNSQYWPTSANQDINAINTNLGLNIIPNNITYQCDGVALGTSYCCDATLGGQTLRVEDDISDPVTGACP